MQAVSVNPSVASLTENREQTRPKNGSKSRSGFVARTTVTGSVPRILVHALRRAIDPAVSMALSSVVKTPRGDVHADLILEGAQRRVAVLISDQSEATEALLLVYGGLDAVYRVSGHDATWNVTATAALLEAAEPSLFLATQGAQLAALPTVRRIVTGRSTLRAESWNGGSCGVLHRRRINRHGDWVATFEALVDIPDGQRRAS